MSPRLPPSVLIAFIGAVLAQTGCGTGDGALPWALRPIEREHRFPARDRRGAEVRGGQIVSADDLNLGRMAYVHYCASCHGLDGGGRGPQSEGLVPAPRDFRTAEHKFAAVRSGELPNDDDLARMVEHGMNGTSMPGWGLAPADVRQIIQFIKTFPKADGTPSRWLDVVGSGPEEGQPRPTGEPVRAGRDPWRRSPRQGAEVGKRVYHLKAQCQECHPSYVARGELAAMAGADGLPVPEPRPEPHEPTVLEAAKNPFGGDIPAPDFTRHPLRSIGPDREVADLYVVVAAGVGGVMPSWIDSLPPAELWGLAHYVDDLRRLGQPGSERALRKLRGALASESRPSRGDSHLER
ncbi:MAG: cytochrome c [Deltaproteobacteria bacterium]|nr:cytochrome c [Deltaproteobacteria bacterium]